MNHQNMETSVPIIKNGDIQLQWLAAAMREHTMLTAKHQHVGSVSYQKACMLVCCFGCCFEQIFMSTSVTEDVRHLAEYMKLDRSVFLCIFRQRRNRIKSFVSQLLDFGSVGMELYKQ